MDGWILLHRKLTDNRLWTCEPFTRGQAWVDLLLIASHDKSFFYVRGNKIEVKVGEVAWGEEKLSSRWRWSRTKLRKFLNDLEKEQQIIQHKSHVIQIITILNYAEYQKKEPQTGQQKDSRKTTEEQQKNIYKECIKNYKELLKNVKEEIWDEVFFLWLKYKSERKEAYKKTGMNQMIKKLIEFSQGDPILANQIITDAISRNYAGFFPLKKKQLKSNSYELTEADFR